jgi:hypothetical protein
MVILRNLDRAPACPSRATGAGGATGNVAATLAPMKVVAARLRSIL